MEDMTFPTDEITAPSESVEPSDTVTPAEVHAETAAPPLPADPADEASAPTDSGELFTVKFNKQLRSLSREDAVQYAQKGMKYDTVQPLLDTLKYVATAEGKTLPELVEAIRVQNEQNLFSRLMDRCGDEEIARELMEVERTRHQAAYHHLLEQEQNEERDTEEAVTRRMATEFEDLQREFPQFTEFGQVPSPIVRDSLSAGIPLLDAYLRHEHRERVKADAALATQQAAAEASTGTQASAGDAPASPVIAAMLRGVWGS